MVDVIRSTYQDSGYLLDPHTAIGLAAARECSNNKTTPMITLATAHPAKFPDAVKQAGYPEDPKIKPPHMADLFDREEKYTVLDNDKAVVQNFIGNNIAS